VRLIIRNRILLHMRTASVPLQSFFHVSFCFRFFLTKKRVENAGSTFEFIFKIFPISQILPSPPTGNPTPLPTPTTLSLPRSTSKPVDPTSSSTNRLGSLSLSRTQHKPATQIRRRRRSLCQTQQTGPLTDAAQIDWVSLQPTCAALSISRTQHRPAGKDGDRRKMGKEI
jgi:hypothetical protein